MSLRRQQGLCRGVTFKQLLLHSEAVKRGAALSRVEADKGSKQDDVEASMSKRSADLHSSVVSVVALEPLVHVRSGGGFSRNFGRSLP